MIEGWSQVVRCSGRFGSLLVFLSLAAVVSAQGIYPGVAARVNGVEISNQTWQYYYREVLIQNNVSVVTARNPKRMEELRRQTLDMLIEQELAWQAAKEKGMVATDEDVDKSMAELRASFKNPEGFARKLSNEGYTEQTYREHLRRLLSGRRYLDEISAAAAKVSDAEIRKFYDENPVRLTLPEQVRARYILIRVSHKATDDDRKAVRTTLAEIRRKVKNVADFAEMAKRHSQDGTAASGGDLGLITRGMIEKPAEEAAFSTRPGKMSKVIETPDTFFLVFVEEHHPARLLPLDEVRQQLREFLGKEKADQAVKDELERLRAAGKVEVFATF